MAGREPGGVWTKIRYREICDPTNPRSSKNHVNNFKTDPESHKKSFEAGKLYVSIDITDRLILLIGIEARDGWARMLEKMW